MVRISNTIIYNSNISTRLEAYPVPLISSLLYATTEYYIEKASPRITCVEKEEYAIIQRNERKAKSGNYNERDPIKSN